jgi:hypothetical protein
MIVLPGAGIIGQPVRNDNPPGRQHQTPGHAGQSLLASKLRNAGGAERKECLTKLKEGQSSVTKLPCRPQVLPCSATAEILLCESFLIFPDLCETFPALRGHRPSHPGFR